MLAVAVAAVAVAVRGPLHRRSQQHQAYQQAEDQAGAGPGECLGILLALSWRVNVVDEQVRSVGQPREQRLSCSAGRIGLTEPPDDDVRWDVFCGALLMSLGAGHTGHTAAAAEATFAWACLAA